MRCELGLQPARKQKVATTCGVKPHVGAGDLREGLALRHRRITGLRFIQGHAKRACCQVRRELDQWLRAAGMLPDPQLFRQCTKAWVSSSASISTPD